MRWWCERVARWSVGWMKNAAMSQLIVAVVPTLFTTVIAGAVRR